MKRAFLSVIMAMCASSVFADPKIVDPNPLDPGAFQAVGALVNAASGERCIATAIDDAKVVTSAACALRLQALGPVDYVAMIDGRVAYFQVRQVLAHPAFDPAEPDGSVDFALVKLHFPSVGARWFPSALDGWLQHGCEGLAVSYNASSTDNETARLLFHSYHYVNRRLGLMEFRRRPARGSQMVCERDVGSPIFARGKLAGVLSHVTYDRDPTGNCPDDDDGDPIPTPADCDLVASAFYVRYDLVKPWIDQVSSAAD